MNNFLKSGIVNHLFVFFILSSLATIALYGDMLYSTELSCDFQGYTYNYLHFDQSAINDGHYFNDRVSEILPSYFIFKLFGIHVGKLVSYFVKYFFLIFSFGFYFNTITNYKTTLIFTALFSASSLVAGALSLDYPVSYSLIFFLISLGFAAKSSGDFTGTAKFKLAVFNAGVFYALSLHGNSKILIYSTAIPIISIWSKNKKECFQRLITFSLGGVVSTIFLCIVCFVVANDFIFFDDSLIKWNADIKFAKKFSEIIFNFNNFHEKHFNPAYVFIFFSIPYVVFLFFSKKVNIFYLKFFSSFLLVVFYHFLDGSILGFKTSLWYLPLFFTIISSSNLNTSRLSLKFVYFIFFLSLVISLIRFNFQNFLFENLGIFSTLFISLAAILSLLLEKKLNSIHLATIIILVFVSTLRPKFSSGQYFYSKELRHRQVFDESMSLHDEIEKKFKNSKLIFMFPESSEEQKINKPRILGTRFYSGCMNLLMGNEVKAFTNHQFDYIFVSKNDEVLSDPISKETLTTYYKLTHVGGLIQNHFNIFKKK